MNRWTWTAQANWKAIKDFVLDDIWLFAGLAIAIVFMGEKIRRLEAKNQVVRDVKPHLVYDREQPFRKSSPTVQKENVTWQ